MLLTHSTTCEYSYNVATPGGDAWHDVCAQIALEAVVIIISVLVRSISMLVGRYSLTISALLTSIGMCGGRLHTGGSVHQMEQPNWDVW